MKWLTLAASVAVSGLLTGCVVGPNYKRPPVQTPTAYKTPDPWREAAPKDSISQGGMVGSFQRCELSAYEQQLLNANQSLVAAKERLEEARALARVPRQDSFPKARSILMLGNRYSGRRPEVVTLGNPLTQSTYEIPFLVNYEPDLFGKVRRNMKRRTLICSRPADMYNVDLVLTAELRRLFSLRELDAETQVVQESVTFSRRACSWWRTA